MSDPEDVSQWQAEDVISRGYKLDPEFMKQLDSTRPVDDIDVNTFDAILVAGGQGDAPDVLRLLDDTRIPADTNPAERSVRMVKLPDKVSGTFHSLEGAEAFATIRSYLQPVAKHGENLLGVLRTLLPDGARIPPPHLPGT